VTNNAGRAPTRSCATSVPGPQPPAAIQCHKAHGLSHLPSLVMSALSGFPPCTGRRGGEKVYFDRPEFYHRQPEKATVTRPFFNIPCIKFSKILFLHYISFSFITLPVFSSIMSNLPFIKTIYVFLSLTSSCVASIIRSTVDFSRLRICRDSSLEIPVDGS